MNRRDKLIERFLSKPSEFTWVELERLLLSFGYQLVIGGKTGGSRRRFVHPSKAFISLHKPHPGTILKRYQIQQIYKTLKTEGFLS